MVTSTRLRPNIESKLAQEIERLEAELSTLQRTNLFKIERRVNQLLALVDGAESDSSLLRERLITIAASVALTVAMMKNPTSLIPLFQQRPAAEQVKAPAKPTALFPGLAPGSAPSLARPAKPEAKPFPKPPAKPTAEFRERLAQTLANPIEPEAKPAAKPEAKPEGDFAAKVRRVAANIGADPVDLMTLMSFESAGTLASGTRGPEVPGQGSGVGLIQFMPDTAKELGTSVEELAAMSPVAQLDYVEKYLVKRGFKGGSLKQLYSTVFAGYPDAPGHISDGYHTLDGAVARMSREHRPRAIEILNGGTRSEKFADTKAIIASWGENFQKDPKTGDTIAGFPVTSPRGMRSHPVTGEQRMHQGVDLGTPIGTAIHAIADGMIECEHWPDAGTAGLFTSDKFPGLRFDLLHLDKCLAEPGSKRQVKQGEIIAHTGSWGTGPHLHLAIKSQESGNFLRVRSGWLHWFVTGKKP